MKAKTAFFYGKIPIVIVLLFVNFFCYSQSNSNENASIHQEYILICDTALHYAYSPQKLGTYVDKADSLRREYLLEDSWKFQLAKAWLFFSRKQYDSTLFILEKKAPDFPADTVSDNEYLMLYHLANLNRLMLRYSNAGDYYEKLKELAIRNNHTDYIYESLWGLESIAGSTQDYDLAKTYLDELLDLTKEDQSYGRFKTYQSYGRNAIKRDDHETGLEYLKRCVDLYELDTTKIPNPQYQLSWIYNQMGQVCGILGKTEECRDYYNKSVDLGKKIGYDKITSDSYANLGIHYFIQKEYQKAIASFDSCLAYLNESGDDRLRRISYYYLSSINDSLQDYKKAYSYQKLYAQFADSASQYKYRELYVQERTRFQTEQKEKELEILNINIRNNKIILYSLLSFAVLIIIIIFLLFRQFRLRSKQKLSLLEKQMAESKQEYLRKQMNPHFLFNTLNSIQFFMFNNDKLATNDYMSKFAMLIRKTLENSERDYTPIKDELDTLRLYIELEQLRFKNKFDFEIYIDPELDIIQQKIPTMIIHPFVENAINHGLHYLEKDGKLSIKIKLSDHENILCIVEDNGIGRKKAEEIKLRKNARHQSMGTSITKERLHILNKDSNKHLRVTFVDLYNDKNQASGTRVFIHLTTIV